MDDFDDGGGGASDDGAGGGAPPRPGEDDGEDGDGQQAPPHGSARKREREPTMHWADTGFAGYLQAKVRKLEEQHRSNQALQPALSAVFAGVSIHVNGLTDPSHSVRGRLGEMFCSRGRWRWSSCVNGLNRPLALGERMTFFCFLAGGRMGGGGRGWWWIHVARARERGRERESEGELRTQWHTHAAARRRRKARSTRALPPLAAAAPHPTKKKQKKKTKSKNT